ncbi:unnamed protein product [Rotaria socialis]|uniref:Uncharacterized protein n=4 Tax=Rotaria socialis TaxID=392032 RepID=A0A820L8F7_9BILA|nr:unnamed protein product [Rotaria socialis]
MTETQSSVSTKFEFLVDLNRQEQVDQLQRALANRKEIDNVNLNLSSKRLVLDTSLQSSTIQRLIEQTLGTNVVLLGTNMIRPIDPPLPSDHLNLDEYHLKSLFTTTAHTISEIGVGGEFVEKLESSVINSQADKPTHEMKEIRPELGRIYMLRLSIPEAFGIFKGGEPEISSFASCASSSTRSSAKSSESPTKPKNKRYYKRPCMVLFTHSGSTTVLGISRFHGHDPASTNPDTTIILPELTRDYVFKHLLSIYPNPPVFGRNSIKTKSIRPSTYFKPDEKHYLILKPISVSSGYEWPNPIPDFVEPHELHYISQIIFELTTEQRQSSMSNSQLQILVINPEDKTDDDKKDTDDAKTTTTSSSSSLSMPRFEQYLLQNDLNNSYQVEQWLNNLESSSNSAVEDILEGLSIDFTIK